MKERDDFKVPQPRKKLKPNPYEERVGQLDAEASRLIENEREFTEDEIYLLRDQLEKAIRVNIDQRMKYANQPQQFLDSEANLNDTIQKLSAIEAYPELVGAFIDSKLFRLLIELLQHPNEMIVGETVEVVCNFVTMELEDYDDIYERHLRFCVDMAQQPNFFKVLLKNIGRLDENNVDDYEIVYRTLRILEQLLDFSGALSDLAANQSDLVRYLADRIMPNYKISWRPLDDNKYISSEILVELVQQSANCKLSFEKLSGIEILIESVAVYHKVVPDNADEREHVGNLFNLLCLMMDENGKKQFNRLNGQRLMMQFVMMKNQFSRLALKVLADGFTAQTTQAFIDDGGLKYLFPVLMRQGLKQKEQDEQRVIDESCLTIIKQLFATARGVSRDRVLNKFREKNFEKLLRLVELRSEYSDIVREDEEIKDSDYPVKFTQGLNVIEQVDVLILTISLENRELKANLKQMLKSFNIDPRRLQIVLTRYCREQLAESDPFAEHILKSLNQDFLPYFLAP